MKQQRNTRQRQCIAQAVMARHDHPTADQIYWDVRQVDEKISRGTVYRNLNFLTDLGQITHVKVPGVDRYDSRQDLHYHLLCTNCGCVVDVPQPYQAELDQKIAKETGYQVSRHHTIFEGLCPACQAQDK